VPGELQSLRAIVDASDDQLFALDRGWRYTAFNGAHADAMRALYGSEIAVGDRHSDHLRGDAVLRAARDARIRALAGERFVTRVTVGEGDAQRRFTQLYVPTRGDEGAVAAVVCHVRDVTELTRAEEALRRSEEQYRLIADFSWDWEVWRGPDGALRYVSPSCGRITGHSPAEFIADPGLLERITHPGDRGAVRSHFAEPLQDVPQDRALEFRILRPDGDTRWIGHVCTAVHDRDGVWLGRRESNRDITSRKAAEAENEQRNQALSRLNEELIHETATLAEANASIARLARTDDLTGIANRRHFFESGEKAVSLARRRGGGLAMVSLDLDGFKSVNDAEGHATGDEVLTVFASLLEGLCRAEDLAARVGGDEFCVLLPGIDEGGAVGLAERVLATVRSNMPLRRRGVTVSIGVAVWADNESASGLLQRADDSLYTAKRSGGDALSAYDAAHSDAGPRMPTWRTKPRGRVI
jgi:diguanylate cyclase (GGDEF)-like protein/PAS domain S-box-containing protein